MFSIVIPFMHFFSRKTYNFFYWLFHKPLGIIVIRSFTSQRGGEIVNFNLGDDLNFYMLGVLARKKIMNFNSMRRFRLPITHYTCIGSVYEWCVDSSSIVWGTGSMYGGSKKMSSPKEIHAVRGPLTRKVLLENAIPCPEVFGDPALLLPLVYSPQVRKKYKVGIIPHFVDYDLSNVRAFCEKYKDEVLLIRMQGYSDWKKVIEDICSCEKIISSSLHGLIISDAFNIPNVWILLSDNVKGNNFKYLDYFGSVERNDTQPVDLRDKEIKLDLINKSLSLYLPVKIDVSKLIESCPFLSDNKKRELLKKASRYYVERFIQQKTVV